MGQIKHSDHGLIGTVYMKKLNKFTILVNIETLKAKNIGQKKKY